jgi:hypothetical protein
MTKLSLYRAPVASVIRLAQFLGLGTMVNLYRGGYIVYGELIQFVWHATSGD